MWKYLPILLLTGCTTINHSYIEPNWPEMTVIEHNVSEAEMRDRCVKYTGPMMSPMACAEWNFATKECHIWFSKDFPPSAVMREHEYLHCKGYIRHG